MKEYRPFGVFCKSCRQRLVLGNVEIEDNPAPSQIQDAAVAQGMWHNGERQCSNQKCGQTHYYSLNDVRFMGKN